MEDDDMKLAHDLFIIYSEFSHLIPNQTGNHTIQYSGRDLILVLNIMTLNVSILGNGLLLLFTLKHRSKSRIRATNYIINIVLIDLAIAFIHIPFNIDNNIASSIKYDWLCRIVESLKFLLVSCSVTIAATLSVCRWQLTRNNYSKSDIKSRDQRYILLAWLISIVASIPALFVNDINVVEDGEKYCGEAWHKLLAKTNNTLLFEVGYQIYVNMIHFTVPGCIICFTYTHIRHSLSMSVVTKSRVLQYTKLQRKIIHKTNKVIYLATILMLTFICCWLPIHIWQFIELHSIGFFLQLRYKILKNLLHWIAISYCALNPIIILSLDSIYQKSLWKEIRFLRKKIWPTPTQRPVRSNTSLYFMNRPRRGDPRARGYIYRSVFDHVAPKYTDGQIRLHLIETRVTQNNMVTNPFNRAFELD